MNFANVKKTLLIPSATISPSLAVIVLLASWNVVAAQEAPSIEDRLSDPVYMAWVSEPAVSDCIQCHFDGPGLAVLASGQSGQLTAFSRRQEMDAWVNQDKHTIARRRVEPFNAEAQEAELIQLIDDLQLRSEKVVAAYRAKGFRIDENEIGLREFPKEWIGSSNILSRRICDKLWGEGVVETDAGYQKFRQNCLTCHGGVTTDEPDRGETTLTASKIGIDCLYCHQVGDQSQWAKEHFDSDTWRMATPEYKHDRGMRDLVNTGTQATLCLDCHIGNRDPQKNMFVTHAMYAAGHPPLPSVDVQTFSEQMPRHWQSQSQLYKNLADFPQRDQYFQTNYPGVTEGNRKADSIFWETRNLFVSALMARRHAVQLILQTAASPDWGDYALYDCAACHHELQSESRRQARYLTSSQAISAGGPVTPGRPRQPEWQKSILDVAYRLGERDSFDAAVRLERELSKRFDETPFGDAEAVEASARPLLATLDQIIEQAQRRPFDTTVSRVALSAISQTRGEDLLTYDAARQVLWAIQVINSELTAAGQPLPPQAQAAIEQLNDPEIIGVDVRLPAGREQYIYPDYLGKEFERRAAYTPDALVDRLRLIQKSL